MQKINYTQVENVSQLAKNLINKFYQPLGYLSCNVSSREMWDYAKARAIESIFLVESSGTLKDRGCGFLKIEPEHKEYWQQLKDAVEKL